LAEERDNWHAVVNRAMNCPVHKVIRIYWLAEKLSDFQQDNCLMCQSNFFWIRT
jgi:hypothetical protein